MVSIKKKLQGYRDTCNYIKSLSKELERLKKDLSPKGYSSGHEGNSNITRTMPADMQMQAIAQVVEELNTMILSATKEQYNVLQLIDALVDPVHKNIVMKKYIEGKTHKEIADECKTSTAQVKRWHSEAIKALIDIHDDSN